MFHCSKISEYPIFDTKPERILCSVPSYFSKQAIELVALCAVLILPLINFAKKKISGKEKITNTNFATATATSTAKENHGNLMMTGLNENTGIQQGFTVFLLFAVEVTSLKDMTIRPEEIIRISCSAIESNTMRTISAFVQAVKPLIKPNLSPYCVKTTGISQEEVNQARFFKEVLADFNEWLRQFEKERAIFVVFHDNEIKGKLSKQCELCSIQVPNYFGSYISIKEEFSRITHQKISRDKDPLSFLMEYFQIYPDGKSNKMQELKEVLTHLSSKAALIPTVQDNTFNEISPIKSKEKSEVLAQNYDSLIVLDFEATCLKDMRINPQEIIEFSCVEFDLKEQQIVGTFFEYVKPIFRPNLSPFCIKLTGITQEDVDRADDFTKVYEKFLNWMEKRKGRNFIFATCGDWDLLTMLPAQVRLSNCSERYPDYLKRWINLKKVFTEATGIEFSRDPVKHDLWLMMDIFNLEKEGRWHSARYDTQNLCKVVDSLSRMTVFKPTYSSY